MAEFEEKPREGQSSDEYEAPAVEAVLTPEELEREVLYGGGPSAVCAP